MSEDEQVEAPPRPNNCYLTGIEARFLIGLMTGGQVAIRGPAVAFSAMLLNKLNHLHQLQPVNQEDQQAIENETILISSIQSGGQ